ncbi:hypothetical protein EX30DRAFT_371389 [Ascodesmis nigricans]|uniref:Efficient mitochondria targeting-associated protein 19 n=1 Tax=Ascodesmis nigricans TaxID=341454 RepID=A0A4S2MXR3_9PEZI|nr:hypothetical protein EX30DRAFT_371389 [Ascodesmis nigricans]
MAPHPLSRPRDTLIRAFLLSFIPTILLFDALPIYPRHLVPTTLLNIHAWYIDFFNDVLVKHSPSWYQSFLTIELGFELPVAIWSVGKLGAGNKNTGAVYPVLLVWAVVCALTTGVCVVEFLRSPEMSQKEKGMMAAMYGGYGLIFAAIGADVFGRMVKLAKHVGLEGAKKKL